MQHSQLLVNVLAHRVEALNASRTFGAKKFRGVRRKRCMVTRVSAIVISTLTTMGTFDFRAPVYYFVNEALSYKCLYCDDDIDTVPTSGNTTTVSGFAPLTLQRTQSYIDNDVLNAINAKALLGTSPVADAELGE